ncbi:unnamed protein product [Strongylus vulgaris]|uniref:Uncharacterized protein n=1 Tax=Strongylus vulgaris TaxID=40348 RepID=A0A3P7IM01_STRVU|nr:unnamed protein product [Strongylus vulgaris]
MLARERVELMFEGGCWLYVDDIRDVQALYLGKGFEQVGAV